MLLISFTSLVLVGYPMWRTLKIRPELHFVIFYPSECLLTFCWDDEDDGRWPVFEVRRFK